jgi:hypothetical protein
MVWFMESAAEILATSPALKKRSKDAVPLTRYQEKFVDAAEVIRLDPDGAEVSFMARELVQCTLPHKDPGNIPIWRRQNGSVTLAIQQRYDARTGEPIGYPSVNCGGIGSRMTIQSKERSGQAGSNSAKNSMRP